MSERVRIDVWIWAVRLVKTRAAATEACRGGHVKLGGQPAKASQQVRIGDEVRVRIHGFDRIVVVKQLLQSFRHCCRIPPRDKVPVHAIGDNPVRTTASRRHHRHAACHRLQHDHS